MKTKMQKAKEQAIIKDFIELCTPSVEPDSFTFLVEELIPLLRDARGLLDYDLVDSEDDGLYLRDAKGDKVRHLTTAEAADYIWGKDNPVDLLTPLEQCLINALPIIKAAATSYDMVYCEHEMPAGCVSSDSLFIILSEIRKHIPFEVPGMND